MGLKFALKDRKLWEEIRDKYQEFGRILLCDEDGSVTSRIEGSSRSAADISYQIFSEWVQGKGRQPVEWSTLIDTLRDIQMNDLATHIQTNLNLL